METLGEGIGSGGESDKEREEEAQETAAILPYRLRFSVISIASSHEQMGRDVELFAQHAGRKSVNVKEVTLSGLLRDFAQELKAKEPCTDKKRKKKASKNGNKVQEPIEMLD